MIVSPPQQQIAQGGVTPLATTAAAAELSCRRGVYPPGPVATAVRSGGGIYPPDPLEDIQVPSRLPKVWSYSET